MDESSVSSTNWLQNTDISCKERPRPEKFSVHFLG